jgi:LmbE family N-acetylglucosaminyl deacetylase
MSGDQTIGAPDTQGLGGKEGSPSPARARRALLAMAVFAASAGAVIALVLAGTWRGAAPRQTSWPEPGPSDRLLILAPHPDDEALAAGGLVQRALGRGAQVRIVFLTSGDGFRVAAARASGHQEPQPQDYTRLGVMREDEARSAARALGLPESCLDFLEYPDRGLAPMWLDCWDEPRRYVSPYTLLSGIPATRGSRASRPFLGSQLLRDLTEITASWQPTAAYLPSAWDQNADHWATHAFGISALARSGLLDRVQVASYLIHYAGWPDPSLWRSRAPLAPPAALPGEGWGSLSLSAVERARKRTTIGGYHSQLAVMGGRLRAFERPNELFARPALGRLNPEQVSRPAALGPGGPVARLWARDGRLHAALAPVPERRSFRLALRVSVLGRAQMARWEFRREAPSPPGATSSVHGNEWEVSLPLPGKERLLAVWIGAEWVRPDEPAENLGWRFYRMEDETPTSSSTPSMAARAVASRTVKGSRDGPRSRPRRESMYLSAAIPP